MKARNFSNTVVSFLGGCLLALVMLLPGAASATNTVSALGLTFEPLEGATLSVDANGLHVWPGEPEDPVPWYWQANFFSTNRFGVRALLGEAQSGIFGYPDANFQSEGFHMDGTAYGSMNGVTNQLISVVRGTLKNYYTEYTIAVDLGALGCNGLSYTLYRGNLQLAQSSHAGSSGTFWAYFGNTWPLPVTRVNPFWRLPCGDVGVMIEFSSSPQVCLPGMDEEGEHHTGDGIWGNRIFIRADNPTNSVEYVSHVDVYAGTNLPYFSFTEGRLGMFTRPHKALGQATFAAAGGTLTMANLAAGEEGEARDGVAIELDEPRNFGDFDWIGVLDGANRFDVGLQPIDFITNGATLTLGSMGIVLQEDSVLQNGNVLGTASLVKQEDSLQILAALAGDRVELAVYNQGQLVGASLLPKFVSTVNLSGNPRLVGCGMLANSMDSPPGYIFRVDSSTTVTATNGISFEGDEVRLLALREITSEEGTTVGTNALRIAGISSAVLTVANIPSFTITNESQIDTISEIPSLTITRMESGLQITWPDPNRIFTLESALGPDGPWESGRTAAYAGDIALVEVSFTEPAKLFRLAARQARPRYVD